MTLTPTPARRSAARTSPRSVRRPRRSPIRRRQPRRRRLRESRRPSRNRLESHRRRCLRRRRCRSHPLRLPPHPRRRPSPRPPYLLRQQPRRSPHNRSPRRHLLRRLPPKLLRLRRRRPRRIRRLSSPNASRASPAFTPVWPAGAAAMWMRRCCSRCAKNSARCSTARPRPAKTKSPRSPAASRACWRSRKRRATLTMSAC